jgi:hypothetical protein
MPGVQNSSRKDAVANVFCTVTSNIRGSLVWNLLKVTILAPNSEVAPIRLENFAPVKLYLGLN